MEGRGWIEVGSHMWLSGGVQETKLLCLVHCFSVNRRSVVRGRGKLDPFSLLASDYASLCRDIIPPLWASELGSKKPSLCVRMCVLTWMCQGLRARLPALSDVMVPARNKRVCVCASLGWVGMSGKGGWHIPFRWLIRIFGSTTRLTRAF